MADSGGRDFFISYTGADIAWAEWVAQTLEVAGYSTVLQAWDFRPGDNFIQRMDQALADADRVLAVLSPAYFASEYTRDEWTAALVRARGERDRLLPVRIETCELPPLLATRVYLDLTDLDEQAAAERLLTGVRPGRATRKVGFPGGQARAGRVAFPGHRPAIFKAPPRNPHFTGRGELLQALRTQLMTTKAGAVVQAVQAGAVHGLSGVGKTQLAVEYAHRYAADYDLVWWVPAEEPTTISGRLAQLGRRLRLAELPSLEEQVGVVFEALGQRDRWLLVYDNAQQPTDLEGLWPPGGSGHVLVTSRNPAWSGLATPVAVDVLPRDQAVAFLTQRTGASGPATLEALAEVLGDLPLALEQAAAYMEETTTTPAEYLELIRERAGELFALGRPTGSEQTIATTWTVALDRIRTETPAAEDLLCLCAFLAPDDLPRSLLVDHQDVLPERLASTIADGLAFGHVIGALRDYSLATVTAEAISTHRLVQAVVRTRMDALARHLWAGAAVRLVAAAFPERSDDARVWPACERLLTHALAAAKESIAASVEHEMTAGLRNSVALYLWTRADLEDAQELLKETYEFIEARLGKDHACAATNLGTQGKVRRDLGLLDEAKVLYGEALDIRKSRLKLASRDVAWSLGNLGKVFRELGDLDEALRTHKEALQILKAALPPNDPDMAWGLGNLGRTLRDLGELDKAKRMHIRALAIRKRHYGDDHPDVAWSLRHLGDTLHALARDSTLEPTRRSAYLSETHDCYQQALAIFKEVFGPDHPEVEATQRRLHFLPQGFGDPLPSPDDEFELLFDGANLRPWWRTTGYGYFAVLEGGILQTEGGMGLLWYDRLFQDFILKVDWMALSPEYNSGVFIRFPDPGNNPDSAKEKGYEVQIVQIDDSTKSKDEGSLFQTGAINGFQAPKCAAAKPVGKWNRFEIEVVGQSYTVVLNEEAVVDGWDGAIGGRGTEGYIGLQNHHQGSRVRFRNIRLKEL